VNVLRHNVFESLSAEWNRWFLINIPSHYIENFLIQLHDKHRKGQIFSLQYGRALVSIPEFLHQIGMRHVEANFKQIDVIFTDYQCLVFQRIQKVQNGQKTRKISGLTIKDWQSCSNSRSQNDVPCYSKWYADCVEYHLRNAGIRYEHQLGFPFVTRVLWDDDIDRYAIWIAPRRHLRLILIIFIT
jgi:hypothetical protein